MSCHGCENGVKRYEGYHWVPVEEEDGGFYCYPCPTEKVEPTRSMRVLIEIAEPAPPPELKRCMIKRLKFGPDGEQ